ncbi:MAG: protein kinase, partial [Polyangiaceae bacterium]|nr:protein kinase [Polyangiaceae bacterium]
MTTMLAQTRLIGGRYVLEKLIGEGGTGEVWRARHTALRSPVAIKFLHGSAAFRESPRRRFLTEARVAAQLNTRHAVKVFDFGVSDQGRPYLIMELLDGESLANRLGR